MTTYFLQKDDVLCSALGKQFTEYFIEEKQLAEMLEFKDWSAKDLSEETKKKELDLYLEHMWYGVEHNWLELNTSDMEIYWIMFQIHRES